VFATYFFVLTAREMIRYVHLKRERENFKNHHPNVKLHNYT